MFGQVAITGQIRGVVTDSTGGALPNVSITAKSSALMTPRKATTGTAGSYLFDSLPPGSYELTYTVSGFKSEVQSNIAITPGFTATISPQLQIGSADQSVVVSAEAPVVDTTDNTSSVTFDDSLLQGIPSGRDTFSTVAQATSMSRVAKAFSSLLCKSMAVFLEIRSTASMACVSIGLDRQVDIHLST
jgi:hypothetical protein